MGFDPLSLTADASLNQVVIGDFGCPGGEHGRDRRQSSDPGRVRLWHALGDHDLSTFAHLHLNPTSTQGLLRVTTTFPTAGSYVAHVEFRRQGQMQDVLATTTLDVNGPGYDRRAPVPTRDQREVTRDGVMVNLDGEALVGRESDFTFRFTNATTGRAVTGLKPYLGAAGHVVIIKTDGTGFEHQHAETTDSHGRFKFAVPGSTFGPSLDLHAQLASPGTYRLWAQFRLPDDRVITAPFTVTTSPRS